MISGLVKPEPTITASQLERVHCLLRLDFTRACLLYDSNLPLPDFRPCFRLPIYIHLRNLNCIMTLYLKTRIMAVRVAKVTLQKKC
jgi:hypothetical protein